MATGSFGLGGEAHPLRREINFLLQAAMLVFVYTVVFGILNGIDVVDFGRKAVLSHVHAGTLGWITMCVFAASFWLFGIGETPGAGSRRAAMVLAGAAVITLPVFAFSFAFTYGEARPILGTLALVTIVGFFAWVLSRVKRVTLSTTHLGLLAAVATSVAGGVLGVLLATKIAKGWDVAPSGIDDAHPGTMVVGFLIPVGMALAEWGFTWPKLTPAGRLGTAQMALPFAGGLILMIGLLFEITPLGPIAALVELAGVGVFIKRLWPAFRRTPWWDPGMVRFAAACGIAIVANIVFINYLAGRYKGDFDKVPDHLLLALDHTMFIGVLTNAIFALLLGSVGASRRWRLVDHAVFFAINLGLIGFVAGLLADEALPKQIFTPLMGAGILLGLGSYSVRLWVRERAPALRGELAPA